MGGKKPLRRPLWPPTRATASNYYPLGLDGAGGAAKPLLRAPKKPAPLHGRLPAFSGAVDAFERARKCFLEWRYFFSIILSEFLKNRVALQEWPDYICIVYRNEVSGKTIYFDYTRMTQGYVNDFEVNSDTATSSVLVNGMQGYLFQEKNWERQRSSITWIDSDKNLQFTIHAYLPQSRILQMAESVSEIP